MSNPDDSRGGSSFFGDLKRKLSSRKKPENRGEPSTRNMSTQTTSTQTTGTQNTSNDPARLAPPPADGDRAPPPHYTPLVYTTEAASTIEDEFAFLANFDTIFLIDDSGSMQASAGPGGAGAAYTSRWDQARDVIQRIAPICTFHDADGIDVYFLNHLSAAAEDARLGKGEGVFSGVSTPAAVQALFDRARPNGLTPTGASLWRILNPYMARYRAAVEAEGRHPAATGIKPVNIIVITDGRPTDTGPPSSRTVESVILSVAGELARLGAPRYQVGIQFFQVGDDSRARDHLRELDDNLGNTGGLYGTRRTRDIVDTVTFDTVGTGPARRFELTADCVLKTVLGAVVKKLDQKVLRSDLVGMPR